MRVLVLSNTPFLPSDAGNRARIAGMIDHLLGAGHQVAMLMLPADDRPEWYVDGMRARLAWLEIVTDEGPSTVERARARLARVVRHFADPDPSIDIDAWCPAWFRARAHDRIRAWKPDVVLVEYVFLSACLDGLAAVHRCVTVIDTHDLMHRRRAVYRDLGMRPQWFHTTRDEERRGLARADVVLAIHEEEAAVLRAMVPERRVLTVPHARTVRPAPPAQARPRRLLFVGSYNDLNVRGLTWLLDAVWPALRTAVPGIELHVCGNIDTKLGPLPPGVVARGFVDAIETEYAAARVVVCPTLGGTGLAVKAVDALCHGRPIVSTRAGASGLDVGETEGVLVADDAGAFCEAVRTLIADDARWRAATAAATAQATRRFTPEVVFGPLVAELERLAGERTAP